jgi:hypothetical protein
VDGALTRRLVAPFLTAVTLAACGGGAGTQPSPPKVEGPPSAASPAPPKGGGGQGEGVNASAPGDVTGEPATLHSLAVRWPVRGDANLNATVAVEYRATGAPAWRAGYPLFRPRPEHQSADLRVSGGWLFAGSIVGLTPDTEYEVRLTLRDPDGGDAERLLRLRTVAEPREPAGMRTRHVAPGDGGGAGTAADPFRGLAAAEAAAAPGDLFLLAPGVYRAAPWRLVRHGAPGRPIIYRGAAPGVVLDGEGGERAVSAQGTRHVWLEGVTLRNARYLYVGNGGSDLVVRRARFEMTRVGFEAINGGYAESRSFFVTDNEFVGPSRWPRSSSRAEPVNAISVSGAGHVIAWNHIRNVGDGVHGTDHGRLSASDIHGNDIEQCTDDGIEADYADANVRVFENRITNCFSGVSAQPIHGGPLYVFRNAMVNLEYSPVKLHNDTAGVLIFHNTSLRAGRAFVIDPAGETVNDVVTRNNLFAGTSGPALSSTGKMIRCDFDRDGYTWETGPFAQWNGRTYLTHEAARASGQLYRGEGALRLAAARLFASGLRPPPDFRAALPREVNDLRLAAGSPAVGRGVPVPNFSDGFRGRAPDLGCCPEGAPLPRYGPRS